MDTIFAFFAGNYVKVITASKDGSTKRTIFGIKGSVGGIFPIEGNFLAGLFIIGDHLKRLSLLRVDCRSIKGVDCSHLLDLLVRNTYLPRRLRL